MSRSALFFGTILLVEVFLHFSSFNIPFFTDDPALYASLSKNMVISGNYWEMYSYGIDWLDKPHFPFWVTALSFKLFGISIFSYRLPALIFLLISALYTYQLTKKLYDRKVAVAAVVILLSAQHLFMSSVDVRGEHFLIALVIGSVYHFYHLQLKFSLLHLIFGALLAACAVMTKGIYALIPIGSTMVGEAIFRKRFLELFRWRWAMAALLIIIFILPELYAVYTQFDAHPERKVFGKNGVSGVKWFLWDSQFSRFNSSGPITRTSSSLFYYLHTLLWAFAPWCFLLYYAIVVKIKNWQKNIKPTEVLTLSAIVPMIILFSISRFQLNFYTNILFPFFSIIVAAFIISTLPKKAIKISFSLQWINIILVIGAVILITIFSQPANHVLYFVAIFFIIVFLFFVLKKRMQFYKKILLISIVPVLFLNFFLNQNLYPLFSSLKSERSAALYLNKNYPEAKRAIFSSTKNGFQFFSEKPVQVMNLDEWASLPPKAEVISYITNWDKQSLLDKKIDFRIIDSFPHYPSESISLQFLRKTTRGETLKQYYLITK